MAITIRRIEARANLDDAPEQELEAVRRRIAAGDESWRRWLEEYERGEAMLLMIDLTVTLRDGDREDKLAYANRGLWVEDHVHPPKIEQQVAELAHKDFGVIAADLAARGADAGREDLEEMFVAVELGDDIVDRIGGKHRHLGEGIESTPGVTSDPTLGDQD